LFVSEKQPQISLAIPVYYEWHDLLHDAAERKEDFADFDQDISKAVKEGIKKYMKYYTFMDNSDIYYTALVLDPRVKGDLLLHELEEDSGEIILQALRENINSQYPEPISLDVAQSPEEPSQKKPKVGSRMLRKLQPRDQPQVSDIDKYFESPRVDANDMEDPSWLCNWWKVYR
jgi:hypothetical protein